MTKKRLSGTIINMGKDPNWLVRLSQPLSARLRETYDKVYTGGGLSQPAPKPSLAVFAGYALARGLEIVERELADAAPKPASKKSA